MSSNPYRAVSVECAVWSCGRARYFHVTIVRPRRGRRVYRSSIAELGMECR